MSAAVAPAPLLPPVRRDCEASRLEPQLLALAYEQLLPIIRSQHRPTATNTKPVPPRTHKEVPEHARS